MTDTLTQRARDVAGRLNDGPYTVGPASGEIRELSEAAAIISELVERIEGLLLRPAKSNDTGDGLPLWQVCRSRFPIA